MVCRSRSIEREGKIFIRSIDPAEVSPGEFAHIIVDTTIREGTKFVVIDSLNGYINAMPDERLLDIRLHELLSYLAQRGVTTLLTLAQHGLFASLEQPGRGELSGRQPAGASVLRGDG